MEMEIGTRILELLEEQEISQRELAKRLHLNYNTVNGYITNRRKPDCEKIALIAQCLDSSADYLVGLSYIRCRQQQMMTKGEGFLIHNYRSLDKSEQKILEDISISLRKIRRAGLKK